MALKYPDFVTVTVAAFITTSTFFISKKPYLSVLITRLPAFTVAPVTGRLFSSVTNPETDDLTLVVRSVGAGPSKSDNSFWHDKKKIKPARARKNRYFLIKYV